MPISHDQFISIINLIVLNCNNRAIVDECRFKCGLIIELWAFGYQ